VWSYAISTWTGRGNIDVNEDYFSQRTMTVPSVPYRGWDVSSTAFYTYIINHVYQYYWNLVPNGESRTSYHVGKWTILVSIAGFRICCSDVELMRLPFMYVNVIFGKVSLTKFGAPGSERTDVTPHSLFFWGLL